MSNPGKPERLIPTYNWRRSLAPSPTHPRPSPNPFTQTRRLQPEGPRWWCRGAPPPPRSSPGGHLEASRRLAELSPTTPGTRLPLHQPRAWRRCNAPSRWTSMFTCAEARRPAPIAAPTTLGHQPRHPRPRPRLCCPEWPPCVAFFAVFLFSYCFLCDFPIPSPKNYFAGQY